MYGMAPGARFEYFLIVLPGRAGGSASWRLEQLDTTSGSRVHRSIGTGVFQGCNHPFVRGARADFKSCASATIRPAAFGRVMQQGGDDPIWFSCAEGCCTADGGSGGTGKA